jgi:CheY-like chemotaxis protein
MHASHAILSVGHDTALLSYRHALLTRAGYKVTSAAHPAKALDLLTARNFDLIIVGGHAASERAAIEQAHRDTHVPVFFLCGNELDPLTGAFQERFSPEDLLEQIATTLSQGQLH